jgi:hypothetical protein
VIVVLIVLCCAFYSTKLTCSVDDCSETNTSVKPDIEELEMLLEAYFAQIDGILQKLSGVCAYTFFSGHS